ncbi:MAG: alpha/beta hydrolase [Bacteroidetes bacterium]|nr:alpha/beta hydrolase [Bacteroidota bacterium]
MKKIIILVLITVALQACISQKVTQSDVFNPVKETALNDNFTFERSYIQNTDTTQIETWYLTENNAELNFIYFSGNGSNIRSAIPFFNELEQQFDLNIFSFNYSGYGRSGGEPSIDGIVRDGKVALDYYENQIGDQNLPTVLLGYSLGGFVAFNLINHDAVDQTIIMSTFTSLEELQDYLLKEALPGIIRPFLKLDIEESIYDLDNIKLVQKVEKPILFVHGEADKFIPASMSYNLYNLCPSEKKEIKIIPGADHRMVLKDSASNKLVIHEIKNFLSFQ